MNWKWYMSIASVRQYMELSGLRGDPESDNPQFARAQNELGELSLTARLVPANKTESGALIYRTNGQVVLANGRKTRLEFTVMPYQRKEGSLPQLLRVTAKGR